MRDIVLFIDLPDSGSATSYHQAARSLGLLPVIVGVHPPGSRNVPASEFLHVTKIDFASVLSAIDQIGQERIAGVFDCSSVGAELAARLAIALDRPHADPDAVSLCNDKHRLRDFLERKGLNNVPYHHVMTIAGASKAVESLGGTVVVKPISSTGSDGVRICPTADEAVSHAKRLLKRKSNGVLIERYIDGPMFSVELFDGRALVVKRNHILEGPFPITIGHDTPAPLETERVIEIKQYASSIVREVGIFSGPSAVQLRMMGTEKYLIEINPRPFLHSTVDTFAATNINMAKLCVKFVCGIPYEKEFCVSKNTSACATRFAVRNGSSVRAIRGVEEARKLPGIKSVHINGSHLYRRGPGTSVLDRIVTVHSKADTIAEATARAELALTKLTVVYDVVPVNILRYHLGKIRNSWKRLVNIYMPRYKKTFVATNR